MTSDTVFFIINFFRGFYCIGSTIGTRQYIECLPYAGFFKLLRNAVQSQLLVQVHSIVKLQHGQLVLWNKFMKQRIAHSISLSRARRKDEHLITNLSITLLVTNDFLTVPFQPFIMWDLNRTVLTFQCWICRFRVVQNQGIQKWGSKYSKGAAVLYLLQTKGSVIFLLLELTPKKNTKNYGDFAKWFVSLRFYTL